MDARQGSDGQQNIDQSAQEDTEPPDPAPFSSPLTPSEPPSPHPLSFYVTDQMRSTYSFLSSVDFHRLVSSEAFGLYLSRRLV